MKAVRSGNGGQVLRTVLVRADGALQLFGASSWCGEVFGDTACLSIALI